MFSNTGNGSLINTRSIEKKEGKCSTLVPYHKGVECIRTGFDTNDEYSCVHRSFLFSIFRSVRFRRENYPKMGRHGIRQWKLSSSRKSSDECQQRGRYSSVSASESSPSTPTAKVATIELVPSDRRSLPVPAGDGDDNKSQDVAKTIAYYFNDEENNDTSSEDGSLEDAYEVYRIHASSKSTIRTVAVTTLVVLMLVPMAFFIILFFMQSAKEGNSNSFPAEELLGDSFISKYHVKNEIMDADDGAPPYDARVDFRNVWGNVPPYWEDLEQILNSSSWISDKEVLASISGLSTWGPCYPSTEKRGQDTTQTYSHSMQIDWKNQIRVEIPNRHSNDHIIYPSQNTHDWLKPIPQSHYYAGNNDLSSNHQLSGLCRPGFLIIGQAKCGTSSLYHYLIGHPRVLPASEKQINYFTYLSDFPMQWYLSHFPPVETFLARGSLMTGESSPSYFPYPKVPHLIHERMSASKEVMKGKGSGAFPKIVSIVRDPIARAISSYEYNYAQPALKLLLTQTEHEWMQSKDVLKRIPVGMSESYYRENHLFSFEDLVRAELQVLWECLKPGGMAEQKSREQYGPPDGLFADAFRQRDAATGNQSLVNADEFCYGERINSTVPLAQWAELILQHPDKIIDIDNLHLVRSIVGRGLYILFLDWWYEYFSPRDVYIVCTEDLHYRPNDTLLELSAFLGLPEFDFTNVTNVGMYNVGFHKGYDTVTSWDAIQEKSNEDVGDHDLHDANFGYEVNISKELRKELMNFYLPYNERLFQVSGKKCSWDANSDD